MVYTFDRPQNDIILTVFRISNCSHNSVFRDPIKYINISCNDMAAKHIGKVVDIIINVKFIELNNVHQT